MSGHASTSSSAPAVPGHGEAPGEESAKKAKRAGIKRGGQTFSMPTRQSAAEKARDQELLDAIPIGLALEDAKEAVAAVRRMRPVCRCRRPVCVHPFQRPPTADQKRKREELRQEFERVEHKVRRGYDEYRKRKQESPHAKPRPTPPKPKPSLNQHGLRPPFLKRESDSDMSSTDSDWYQGISSEDDEQARP